MQQITVTKAILKRFGIEYLRLPDVDIGNPYKVKSDYIVIVAWMAAMANEPNGIESRMLSAAFGGWLLGQDMFTIMEDDQKDFEREMVVLYKEANVNGT
jgi:hypothetical protein